MFLTPELIETVKSKVNDPEARGENRLLRDCVMESPVATPKHELFSQIQQDFPSLPKLVFYIIMDSMYVEAKAPSGHLGWLVKYVPEHPDTLNLHP